MPERKDQPTGTEPGETDGDLESIYRRRLLQVAGASVVAGTVATGVLAASSDRPHLIVFDGSGTTVTSSYEFGVSGSVAADGDAGELENDDEIDGTSVSGTVTGDVDAYRFGGNLTHLDVSGPVEVSITYADTTPAGPDRLEIVTPSDGSVEYTMTVDGDVEKVLDNGDNSAEVENDSITENGDGTRTVTGLTGNGFGDSYDVDGDVTHFEPASGQYTLFLNGDEISLADLTGQDPSDGDGSEDEDGSEDDDGDDNEEPSEHELVIVTPADGSVDYEMTTEGQITKVLDAGDDAAEEQNDTVTQNDDGTWSITGMTGNGYGDTLLFVGEPLAFDGQGEFTLYLDGEEITPEELVGEEQDDGDGTLEEAVIRVGFDHDDWLHYSLHVDSEPEPLSASEDEYFEAASYDQRTLSDGTYLIEGQTGTADPSGPMFGDGYRVEPADGNGILGFEASPPGDREYVVSVNETEVDPGTLPALDLPEEEPDDSDGGSAEDGPIGGGQGYANAVTRDQADTVVSSGSDLSSGLSAAGSGDVVFVEGSVDVDLGSSTYDVPSGVTLASDRGVSGSSGARLQTSREPSELFRMHGDSRITGLRIAGPHPGGDTGGDGSARAISVLGDGVEIDNCDISAFSYAGVFLDGGDGHIHHNVIRECNRGGLGYGISMVSGNPTIEYNYFNYNRHSVATDGSHHGYVCRYNHFGPDLTSHVIDMHEPAGTRYEVHNNVVEGYVDTGGGQRPGVAVRAAPDEEAVIEGNWFWNPDPPLSSPSYTWTDEAIIQPETDDYWHNVSFSGNHYGENAGVSFADVIPGYDGWRSD